MPNDLFFAQELAQSENFTRCPNCTRWVTRVSGCPSVECICGHLFQIPHKSSFVDDPATAERERQIERTHYAVAALFLVVMIVAIIVVIQYFKTCLFDLEEMGMMKLAVCECIAAIALVWVGVRVFA